MTQLSLLFIFQPGLLASCLPNQPTSSWRQNVFKPQQAQKPTAPSAMPPPTSRGCCGPLGHLPRCELYFLPVLALSQDQKATQLGPNLIQLTSTGATTMQPQGRVKMSKSKSLKELREALQRQAKETLKLQEEATKFSVESISHREGTVSPCNMTSASIQLRSSSPTQLSSSMHSSSAETSTVPSSALASSSPPKILYTKYEKLDVENQRRSGTYSGKEHIETILEEYSQQVRELQKRLSETTECHEKQKFTLRQTIIELQTSLREVQREKDSIADLRRRESQSQDDLAFQLKSTITDLQTASQLQEGMLKEANSQTEHLRKMIQGHEDVLQQLRNVLLSYEETSGKKVYEHESIASLHICSLPSAFSKVLQDLESEVLYLKGKLASLEDQLTAIKKESDSKTDALLRQHQDSMERLISEHEKEMVVLCEKAKASQSHANSIQSQLEIIQEQARNQNSLYARQVSQLESTVSQLRSEVRESRRTSEDKIEDLEKQLLLARSEAESERDQYSQEAGNLDEQVQQLAGELSKKDLQLNLEKEQNKRLWDRDTGSSITIDHLRRELDNRNMELQRMESLVKSMKVECQEQMERQMSAIRDKNEIIDQVASLTAQQESTKEMLRKVVDELNEKKISLEAAERRVAELTLSLQEKEKVIASTNEEIQKLRGRVDSKFQELQQLKSESDRLRNMQSECESFRLQVAEKEKVIEILQKQIDNMTQIVGQHGRTAGAMEMEKAQLLKEVNDRKMEIQELKILQDKKDIQLRDLEACLSEMELDRVKLVNASSDRLRALKEMKLEREGLMTEIKASRIEVAALAEESESLKKNYRDKTEEMDIAVTKLSMQLKSAQIELEQTRATLKSVEGSDGHAMKVAMGMQKQITAKRGQIDALQSKIKFLEEAMTNSTKEKHYLKEERNKLSQELASLASLNNKMSGELEILKSQDKRLKEKLATMEAALDKASMQFAECQCIMQQQEQEVIRFKFQHALDVKELQGPGHSLSSSMKQRHSSVPHSLSSSAPASQSFAGHHINLLPPRVSSTKEDPLRDLKHLLQELKTTIDEIPSTMLPRRECDSDTDSLLESPSATLDLASRECIGKRSHEPYNRKTTVRDLPSDATLGQDHFSRDPITLHTTELEDSEATLPFTSTIFSSTPRYSSSKKLSPEERFKDRSPVHSLLTAPLNDLKTVPGISLEHRSGLKKSSSPETVAASYRSEQKLESSWTSRSSTQTEEADGSMCKKLQNKMDNLQNLVETLQLKNQAMSTMIRSQEKKLEKAKEKEKKLSK
ncbi:coiled-coil domain-containing protein 158 [Tiliqua scincoides]|uniref:coiled-coil domain-containing protein 158 n=1 Tax=Tiliqua scincoides TaxID=71010 RepID=UPI003462859E